MFDGTGVVDYEEVVFFECDECPDHGFETFEGEVDARLYVERGVGRYYLDCPRCGSSAEFDA